MCYDEKDVLQNTAISRGRRDKDCFLLLYHLPLVWVKESVKSLFLKNIYARPEQHLLHKYPDLHVLMNLRTINHFFFF